VILFRGGSYSDAEMLALLDRVLKRVSEHDLQHSITVGALPSSVLVVDRLTGPPAFANGS
jgi:hypothetical protein